MLTVRLRYMHTICIHCKYVSISMSSCKCEYMFLSVCLSVWTCVFMFLPVCLSVCLNMRMYSFIVCLSAQAHVCLYPRVSIRLAIVSISLSYVYMFYFMFLSVFLPLSTCAKASFNAHFVVSGGPYLLLNLHLHLTLCM